MNKHILPIFIALTIGLAIGFVVGLAAGEATNVVAINDKVEPNNYIVVDGKEYEVLHDECETYTSKENTIWIGCYLDEVGVFTAIGYDYFVSGVKGSEDD